MTTSIYEAQAFYEALYGVDPRSARGWAKFMLEATGSPMGTQICFPDGSKIELLDWVKDQQRIFRY